MAVPLFLPPSQSRRALRSSREKPELPSGRNRELRSASPHLEQAVHSFASGFASRQVGCYSSLDFRTRPPCSPPELYAHFEGDSQSFSRLFFRDTEPRRGPRS